MLLSAASHGLPRRPTLLCLALAAALLGARPAAGQIDTAAASEARAALRAVVSTYGNRTEWSAWSRLLKVPDVRYELRAGDRAERAALRNAVLQLLSGRVPQFVEPEFMRLAQALDVRAQELGTMRASDWPSACRMQAENYAPITPEALEAEREALARRLDEFERYLPAIREPNNAWNKFLFWPQTRSLAPAAPGPAPNAGLLDRLEMRWADASIVWEDDLLFDTSVAVRTYIRMLRIYLRGETRGQHAAAWVALASLLEKRGPQGLDTSAIGPAVTDRERLGQASRLTASVRRGLSHPNLIVQVDREWLERESAQRFNEAYDVDGVFAGTRSVGRGRMVGTTRSEILPSTAVGQWRLRMRGTSTSRAVGSQRRVTVVSRATTRVSATKPFELNAGGLIPRRASAGAIASIAYESVNASGLGRRRAVSETYARRGQAETESAAYARRSILERINAEAAEAADNFNRTYRAELRDPRINAGRPGPDVRVRSSGPSLRWECLLAGPTTFGAPLPPPEFDPGTQVVMHLAASALEEQGVIAFAGRQMTGAELQETIGPALGESDKSSGEDFNVTFDTDPCDIRVDNGAIHARLYITKFDSADVKYPAMTVDVAYKPEERDGKVVFVREGRVRVTPAARPEAGAPPISGRQQTLRIAVQRKLSKVLTAELTFSNVDLPLSQDEDSKLRVERARVVGPWLQVGLRPDSQS